MAVELPKDKDGEVVQPGDVMMLDDDASTMFMVGTMRLYKDGMWEIDMTDDGEDVCYDVFSRLSHVDVDSAVDLIEGQLKDRDMMDVDMVMTALEFLRGA